MINTEKYLYEALKTTGYKIYPQKSPQNEKNPMVIYNVTSEGFEYGVNSFLDNEDTRFQIDIYAEGYEELKNMQINIISAIRNISKGQSIVLSSADSITEDGRRCTISIKIWAYA